MNDDNLVCINGIKKLEILLNECKEDYEADNTLFCKSKIFKMGQFIKIYSDWMKNLNVKLNEDLLDELRNIDDNLVDMVHKLFLEWDEFLELIEKNLQFNYVNQSENQNRIPNNIYFSEEIFTKIKMNQDFKSISLDKLHQEFKGTKSKKQFIHFIMLRHFA